MSHSPKSPPLATTTANLPEVEDGVLAYDITQGKPVARVAGAWENIAGGEVIGTPTVVYDDGTAVGNTDQIQGDIPDNWKNSDTSLKGLVIGTSCTSIGNGAFDGCTGLTGGLVIPNSVTIINTIAFQDCTGLTGSLVIPDSVTLIRNSAFSGCSGFTSLTIGNNVTRIAAACFIDCTGLTGTLTIPNNVTEIGIQAFFDCSGLTNVDCYVERSVLDVTNCLNFSGVTTIHVRSTDSTWVAGAGQTIGGKTGITVIKDL